MASAGQGWGIFGRWIREISSMKEPESSGPFATETWRRPESEMTTSGFALPSRRMISRESSCAKASNRAQWCQSRPETTSRPGVC